MAEVNIPAELLAEAARLGLDLDGEVTQLLRQRLVAAAKERTWQEENREAIESMNAWVAEHGLPLAEYQKF